MNLIKNIKIFFYCLFFFIFHFKSFSLVVTVTMKNFDEKSSQTYPMFIFRDGKQIFTQKLFRDLTQIPASGKISEKFKLKSNEHIELPLDLTGKNLNLTARIATNGSVCRIERIDTAIINMPMLPISIKNPSANDCQIEVDYAKKFDLSELLSDALFAKAKFLGVNPKNANCAYYKVDVTPGAMPYSPNGANGIYFFVDDKGGLDVLKMDPSKNTQNNLHQCGLSDHYFYPVNGVFFDPKKESVTPLKQSVVLELPYDGVNSKSVMLYQGASFVANADFNYIRTQLVLPVPTQEERTELEQIKQSCSGISIKISTESAQLYANGSYANPLFVELQDGSGNNISPNGNVALQNNPKTAICSKIYDRLFFTFKNSSNDNTLISNSLFDVERSQISILPKDAVEMKDSTSSEAILLFPKYGTSKTDTSKKIFYLYANELSTNNSISANYFLNSETSIDPDTEEPQKPTIKDSEQPIAIGKTQIPESQLTTNDPLLDAANESDEVKKNGKTRVFFLSNSEDKISNPNSQRLDYVVGLKATRLVNDNEILKGVFYSFFGGVMSSCNDEYVPEEANYSNVYDENKNAKGFSLLCKNGSIMGYLGYQNSNSGKYDNMLQTINSFAINDSFHLRDPDYPDEVRKVNRLVLFDAYGTPLRYIEGNWRNRIQIDKNVRFVVGNMHRSPLFLWQEDRNKDLIEATNLGGMPNGSSLKNLNAIYVAKGGQVEISSKQNEDYAADTYTPALKFGASYSPVLSLDIRFDFSHQQERICSAYGCVNTGAFHRFLNYTNTSPIKNQIFVSTNSDDYEHTDDFALMFFPTTETNDFYKQYIHGGTTLRYILGP